MTSFMDLLVKAQMQRAKQMAALPHFPARVVVNYYDGLTQRDMDHVDSLLRKWDAAGGDVGHLPDYRDMSKSHNAGSAPVGPFMALIKGPPGGVRAGWQIITNRRGGKRGQGYRRRHRDGGWEYWYPDKGTTRAHKKVDKERHKLRKVGKKGRGRRHQNVAVAGKWLHDAEHMKPGAEFDLVRDGVEGHVVVLKNDGGTLDVQHTGTGELFTISANDLAMRLKEHHVAGIAQHRQKLRREMKEAELHGTHWQRAKLRLEARTLDISISGDYDGYEGDLGNASKAEALHEAVIPDLDTQLPEDIVNFPRPDKANGIFRLYRHQAEGAARIVQAWSGVKNKETGEWKRKPRNGFLLQDEAGLGKTMTAMAALRAHGGKRNLIVVPTRGKQALMEQWRGPTAAGLYGIDLKPVTNYMRTETLPDGTKKKRKVRGVGMAAVKDPGYYICAYNDLYKTEPVLDKDGNPRWDPKTNKPMERVVLRPEFRGKFDTITFDESHTMRLPSSKHTQAATQLQARCDKVLYMSATPLTGVRDVHYLRKMGTKEQGWFETAEEFAEWAHKLGAKINPNTEGMGDMPVGINNPKSPRSLAALAAKVNFEGVGIKREPSLPGLHSEFQLMSRTKHITPHMRSMFDAADKLTELATQLVPISKQGMKELDKRAEDKGMTRLEYVQWYREKNAKVDEFGQIVELGPDPRFKQAIPGFNVGGIMNQWYRMAWEVAKADKAIEQAKQELAEGRQVAILTQWVNHSNQPLQGFVTAIKNRGKDKIIDPAHAKRVAAEVAKLLKTFPDFKYDYTDEHGKVHTSDTLPGMIASALGGPSNVAEIHGGIPKGSDREPSSEQKAYQRGDKKVMVGTISMAGTGLSFHNVDKSVGESSPGANDGRGRPRTQINLTMPTGAQEFQQVSGRSHRLGMIEPLGGNARDETRMVWLSGEHRNEMLAARLCMKKMMTMGALVAGNSDLMIEPTAADMTAWNTNMGERFTSIKDVVAILTAEFDDEEKAAQQQQDAWEAGVDTREQFRWAARKLADRKDPLAITASMRLEVEGQLALSRANRKGIAKLAKVGIHARREGLNNFRIAGAHKGTEGYAAFEMLTYGAKYDKKAKEWIVHDPWVFSRVARNLGFPDSGRKLVEFLVDEGLTSKPQGHRPIDKALIKQVMGDEMPPMPQSYASHDLLFASTHKSVRPPRQHTALEPHIMALRLARAGDVEAAWAIVEDMPVDDPSVKDARNKVKKKWDKRQSEKRKLREKNKKERAKKKEREEAKEQRGIAKRQGQARELAELTGGTYEDIWNQYKDKGPNALRIALRRAKGTLDRGTAAAGRKQMEAAVEAAKTRVAGLSAADRKRLDALAVAESGWDLTKKADIISRSNLSLDDAATLAAHMAASHQGKGYTFKVHKASTKGADEYTVHVTKKKKKVKKSHGLFSAVLEGRPWRPFGGSYVTHEQHLLIEAMPGGALIKAVTHGAPEGYEPIPNSKHGGFRKKVGTKFVYWYPDGQAASKAAAHHAKEAKRSRKQLDRMLKYGRGTDPETMGKMQQLLDEHTHHKEISDHHTQHGESMAAGDFDSHRMLAEQAAEAAKPPEPEPAPEEVPDPDAEAREAAQKEAEAQEKKEADHKQNVEKERRKAERKLGVDTHRKNLHTMATKLADIDKQLANNMAAMAPPPPGKKQSDKALAAAQDALEHHNTLSNIRDQIAKQMKDSVKMLRNLEQMAEADAQRASARHLDNQGHTGQTPGTHGAGDHKGPPDPTAAELAAPQPGVKYAEQGPPAPAAEKEPPPRPERTQRPDAAAKRAERKAKNKAAKRARKKNRARKSFGVFTNILEG